jgi:hypothetical protein
VAAVVLVLVLTNDDDPGGKTSEQACARVDAQDQQSLMEAYAQGSFPARQEDASPGLPGRVTV